MTQKVVEKCLYLEPIAFSTDQGTAFLRRNQSAPELAVLDLADTTSPFPPLRSFCERSSLLAYCLPTACLLLAYWTKRCKGY